MTHGLFEWVDASVPDLTAAAEFYGALMGWDTEPPKGSDGVDYLMCRRDGRLAAGLVLSPSGRAGWNSYVTVDSVDETAERADTLGATVAVGPMDIGEQGRMAYLLDPQGAGLGLWEPGTHHGAEAFNEPGFLTWNELRTTEVAASRRFYEALVPEWTFEDLEAPGGVSYVMVRLDDRENGAIALGEDSAGEPAGWAVWFTVDDAADLAEKVEGLGGSALGSVFQTSYGPGVRLADPFGARFLVIGPMAAPDERSAGS